MVPESLKQRGGWVPGGACASGGAGLGGLFPEALSSRRCDRSPSLPWTGARVVSSSGLSPAGKSLSLSRLNHWLPRGETHPEIMEGTAEFHHEITDAVLPQPDPVFHHAAALDAAVDMLDPQPAVVQGLVGELLFQRQFLAARFLHGHEDLHLGQRERQKAQV